MIDLEEIDINKEDGVDDDARNTNVSEESKTPSYNTKKPLTKSEKRISLNNYIRQGWLYIDNSDICKIGVSNILIYGIIYFNLGEKLFAIE